MNSPSPDLRLPDISRRRVIHKVALWLLVAAVLLVCVGDPALAIVYGSLVLAYIVALLLFRRAWVEVRAEGLARPGGRVVPYHEITSLRFLGYAVASSESAARSRYLLVAHPRGAFRIPKALGLDRLALASTLLDRSSLRAPPTPLPPRLAAVRDGEVADFGAAQVLVTSGRGVDPDDRPTIYPLVGIVLGTAITFLAASLQRRSTDQILAFLSVGVCLAIGWLAFSAIARLRLRALGRSAADLGLVVSPRSLTLESPQLKGTLRWSEVLALREINHRSWQRRGLEIRVAGSTALLPDVFRLPLAEIASVIHRYHRVR
jgi:hypothetical protein